MFDHHASNCFYGTNLWAAGTFTSSFTGRWCLTNEKGDRVSLRQASLPTNQLISVRPPVDETLCAGYNFRFGSETKFFINEESIELNSGSID